MKSHFFSSFYTVVFSIAIYLSPISNVNASILNYSLDNIFLGSTSQMTGNFEWNYTESDFENGTGTFKELSIPGSSKTISDLNITFDIGKSIEFTLIQNLDNDGLDITLVFENALTPTQSTFIDLTQSKWSIGASGTNHLFISGGISPAVVPVPSAILFFGSALLGLISTVKKK